MSNDIIQKIIKKTGQNDLLDILTNKLTFSELNSLLLEIYNMKSKEIRPAELLKLYESNRFVKPYEGKIIDLIQLELKILKAAGTFSFTPVELSPVAALGTCSAVAKANQNKIISALRGTEVLADATNSLALHICDLKRNRKEKENAEFIRYCTIHRHIRAQNYKDTANLPHFKLFCMVTSGIDKGSYIFEKESLLEHFQIYQTILNQTLDISKFKIKFIEVGGYKDSDGFMERILKHLQDNLKGEVDITEQGTKSENQYYQGLQFKIYINMNGDDMEIADGGFVDWPQKLLQNKKERMLISGLGIERLANRFKGI
ncbi:hypothetical protein Ana3638_22620 [Anaerocolumna sedimenticola]|uniref:Uncharacterized protein n=1 Tax=Anaerocolumna sedimenticola TaxID=2696063 RepID=A0A6P1TRX7_9FIRM|nr:hypothetical protein [Anaerocolumna sedimenticola]QHQ63223.1 hypothetical protein Ana3638_22620 [Anaerocolumna sedimenticola]